MSNSSDLTILQLFKSGNICLKNNLQLPSLILMYSSIDILGWMAFGDLPVKKRFTKWIDQFMDSNNYGKISSLDIYGARCAVLHTMTPQSLLSKKNQVKELFYSWGDASSDALTKIYKLVNCRGCVTLHVDSLFKEVEHGYEKFLDLKEYAEYKLKRKRTQYIDIEKVLIYKVIKKATNMENILI